MCCKPRVEDRSFICMAHLHFAPWMRAARAVNRAYPPQNAANAQAHTGSLQQATQAMHRHHSLSRSRAPPAGFLIHTRNIQETTNNLRSKTMTQKALTAGQSSTISSDTSSRSLSPRSRARATACLTAVYLKCGDWVGWGALHGCVLDGAVPTVGTLGVTCVELLLHCSIFDSDRIDTWLLWT